MPKIRGIINMATGTLGGSTRLYKALLRNVDPSIVRKFDGFDIDIIKKLPIEHADRVDANKIMAATKKISKMDRAKSMAETGFGVVGRTCGKNVGLCAGAGITAYLNYESYKELKEEQKQCLDICMPEDWGNYKKGRISQPTYKTIDAVSPNDPSLSYAELYPDNKDHVCTRPNLLEDGFQLNDKDSCDKFCQNVCDFTLRDVLTNAPTTGANMGADIIKKILKDIFGDIFGDTFGDGAAKTAMIGSSVLCCLILLIIVFMKIIK
jgi:hypothetical protein